MTALALHKPEVERYPLTQFGNAERFVDQHGRDLRYCHDWKEFLYWNGSCWTRDTTAHVHRLGVKTIRSMYREASEIDDDKERKMLAKWALQCETERHLNGMINLARHHSKLTVEAAQLDADPWLLNCANGVIDLRTGVLKHHHCDYLLMKRSAIKYDPDAACPVWEKFLNRIFAGDVELIHYIQKSVGYTLTGIISEQKFFFAYGTGANGKSTFFNVLMKLLGDFALKTPTRTLMSRKEGDNSPTNDLARLRGQRLAVAAELEDGHRLSESVIKDLTGDDIITARYLYSEWFEFRPTHKVWMYGNHKPIIRGTDPGIWRRPQLIPFKVQIPDGEKDRKLGDKLAAELPGILAWAVRGCLLWQQEGLEPPAAVRDATQEYRAEMDVMGLFVADRCVIAPSAWATAGDLYDCYKEWCEETGEYQVSQRRFGMWLRDRGYERERGPNGRWRWRGIGILEGDRVPVTPEPPSAASETPQPNEPAPEPAPIQQELIEAPPAAAEALSLELVDWKHVTGLFRRGNLDAIRLHCAVHRAPYDDVLARLQQPPPGDGV